MTERVLGPTGSPRRRWTVLLPLVAAIALGLFYITGAQAVHDFGGLGDGGVFELDNNATDDATQAGPPPVNAGDDWATLMGGGPGNAQGSADEQTNVPVVDPVNFQNDDTFCGGTKENQDLAAWKWCNNAASNDKNDIEDAYSAIYTVPNTATGICPTLANPQALCAGDKILYVGADRFANNGDSGLGFMFLQSGLAGNTCPVASTNCTFNNGQGGTPHHTNGDIYVVSQFTGGGQGVTVDFYVWAGGNAGNWQLDTTGVDCDISAANDIACGTVFGDGVRSTNTCVDAPWTFVTKFPGDAPCTASDFAEGTFFEGGVNLTQRNITGCFKTILVDTSQSQNINEAAQDFVFAPFEGCSSGIVTTPQTGAGGSIDETTGVDIPTQASNETISVRDHAEIDVNGTDTFGGTVTFFLCGPFSSNATNCSSGGVQIGSPVPVTGTLGEDSLNSDAATLTSIGHYCWRAVYSGDASVGVPGSSDPAATDTGNRSECFKVNPITPTLTTSAGPDVNLNSTISDTASLTGTARKPGTNGIGGGTTGGLISPGSINATNATAAFLAGGTITFSVNGPGPGTPCTASGLAVTGSPVTVSGDNTSYGPVTALPTAVGAYTWIATYSGSSPNTNGVGPTGCPESSEEVVVTGGATSSSKQRWLPNDRVVLTSSPGTNLTGTLTITLYSGTFTVTDGVCTPDATATLTGYSKTYNPAGDVSGTVYQTDNTTFFVGSNPNGSAGGAAGSYFWLIHYVDTFLDDPKDHCETSTVSPITD